MISTSLVFHCDRCGQQQPLFWSGRAFAPLATICRCRDWRFGVILCLTCRTEFLARWEGEANVFDCTRCNKRAAVGQATYAIGARPDQLGWSERSLS